MEELPKYLDVEERKIITELNNEIMKSDTSQIVIVKDHFNDNGPSQ
jgi:hypothetical protein